MKKRTVAVLCAVAAVLGVIIGGTMAYLQHSASVVNTFTAGNITIALSETKDGELVKARNDYVMVPGMELDKDPRVAVKEGSEDCYLFVKVTKDNWMGDPIEYTIADGWTPLEDVENVYYRVYDRTNPGVELTKDADKDENNKLFDGYLYPILALEKDGEKVPNVVKVSANLTKDNMTSYGKDTDNYPKLNFTAYAIQKNYLKDDGSEATPKEAWELVQQDGVASGT